MHIDKYKQPGIETTHTVDPEQAKRLFNAQAIGLIIGSILGAAIGTAAGGATLTGLLGGGVVGGGIGDEISRWRAKNQ